MQQLKPILLWHIIATYSQARTIQTVTILHQDVHLLAPVHLIKEPPNEHIMRSTGLLAWRAGDLMLRLVMKGLPAVVLAIALTVHTFVPLDGLLHLRRAVSGFQQQPHSRHS
jgi:hypothetical protein